MLLVGLRLENETIWRVLASSLKRLQAVDPEDRCHSPPEVSARSQDFAFRKKRSPSKQISGSYIGRRPAPFRDFSIDQDHSDRGAKHWQLVPCLCVPGRNPRCDPIVDLRGDECLAHPRHGDGSRKVTSTGHAPECRPRERGAVADLVDADQIELHKCDPFKENCDHTLL